MSSERYSLAARLLHWAVAILVLAQIALGFGADWSERPVSDRLLDQHVRIGVLVLALLILRLSWRFAVHPPSMPGEVSRWRSQVATIVHRAFYALLIIMPVSGYVVWAWTGPTLDWWGIGQVPIVFRGGDAELWRSVAGYSHEYGAYAMTSLILLHIAGALHHQFVERNNLIRRRMGFGALDGGQAAG